MPGTEVGEDLRGGKLLSVLFWAGVGLAPLALLLLLVGSSTGMLKAAIGVVIISVILIGLSITLKRDTDTLKVDLEDLIYDEIDAVRADVRDDITHAAQSTHRSFGEKLQHMAEQLDRTRRELDSTRAQLEAVGGDRQLGPGTSSGQHSGPGQGQRPNVPGLVRHTETVQVTTRHTVVDPRDERGGGYGGRSAGRDRGDDSWSDQRLREQLERRRGADEPVVVDRWSDRSAGGSSTGGEDDRWPTASRWADGEDEDRRPAMRAGDRWASVRSDERGRELRMGERRAALHSDERGTELRIEDRWAAVRREEGLDEPRGHRDRDFRDRDRDHRDRDHRDRDRDRDFRDRDRDRDSDRHRERPAITSRSDREERWSDYDEDRDRRYR